MPIGVWLMVPVERPESLAHWLIVESAIRATMSAPVVGHANRHWFKRSLRGWGA